MRHWNRLPGEFVNALLLEFFKVGLDGAFSNLSSRRHPYPCVGVLELGDLYSPFQPNHSMILLDHDCSLPSYSPHIAVRWAFCSLSHSHFRFSLYHLQLPACHSAACSFVPGGEAVRRSGGSWHGVFLGGNTGKCQFKAFVNLWPAMGY